MASTSAQKEERFKKNLTEAKEILGPTVSIPTKSSEIDDFLSEHGHKLTAGHISAIKRRASKSDSRKARSMSATTGVDYITPSSTASKVVSGKLTEKKNAGQRAQAAKVTEAAAELATPSEQPEAAPETTTPKFSKQEEKDFKKRLGIIPSARSPYTLNTDTRTEEALHGLYQHISDVYEQHGFEDDGDKERQIGNNPKAHANIIDSLNSAWNSIKNHEQAHRTGDAERSINAVTMASVHLAKAAQRISALTKGKAKFDAVPNGDIHDAIEKVRSGYVNSDREGKGALPDQKWIGTPEPKVTEESSDAEGSPIEGSPETRMKETAATNERIRQSFRQMREYDAQTGRNTVDQKIFGNRTGLSERQEQDMDAKWNAVPRWHYPREGQGEQMITGPMLPKPLPARSPIELPNPYPDNFGKLPSEVRNSWVEENEPANRQYRHDNAAMISEHNDIRYPLDDTVKDKYGYTEKEHDAAFEKANMAWFGNTKTDTKSYANKARKYHMSKAYTHPAAYLDDLAAKDTKAPKVAATPVVTTQGTPRGGRGGSATAFAEGSGK